MSKWHKVNDKAGILKPDPKWTSSNMISLLLTVNIVQPQTPGLYKSSMIGNLPAIHVPIKPVKPLSYCAPLIRPRILSTSSNHTLQQPNSLPIQCMLNGVVWCG